MGIPKSEISENGEYLKSLLSQVSFQVQLCCHDCWTRFAKMEKLAFDGLAFPSTTQSAHLIQEVSVLVLHYLNKVDEYFEVDLIFEDEAGLAC